MWRRASSPERNRPVASMTTSTPSSAQRIRSGWAWPKTRMVRSFTTSRSARAVTVPGKVPRMLSRRSP
jgi:hypothetical protein